VHAGQNAQIRLETVAHTGWGAVPTIAHMITALAVKAD